MFDDEQNAKKPPVFEVGQDLSLLSVDELRDHIALLRQEIGRIEAEIASKTDSRGAADALFKT